MTTVFVIVVVALFLGLAIVGLVEWNHRRAAVQGAYAQLASKYQGTIAPDDLLQRPSVRFVHFGADVLLNSVTRHNDHSVVYTQIHITWPDARLRCEIYPASMLSRVERWLGVQAIALESVEFESRYEIRGNDPELIRKLLSPNAQAVVDELRQFMLNDEIYIALAGGRLLVKKLGLIQDFTVLETLVGLALCLYDQWMHAYAAAGIEFIMETTPALGLPVCQVCGEAIEADPVLCRACKTPHHKDCWSYYGACSTYGCGEKRFTLAR